MTSDDQHRRETRYPRCDCFAELHQQLRKFKNGSLHVYYVCAECGKRAQSPCPRNHVLTFEKWRQLLVDAGEEVRPL